MIIIKGYDIKLIKLFFFSASLHRKGFSDRQQNIQQIQRVLRGAKDWDGFRRPKSVTEKIQQDKENATSIEAEKSRKDVTKATSSETFF